MAATATTLRLVAQLDDPNPLPVAFTADRQALRMPKTVA